MRAFLRPAYVTEYSSYAQYNGPMAAWGRRLNCRCETCMAVAGCYLVDLLLTFAYNSR